MTPELSVSIEQASQPLHVLLREWQLADSSSAASRLIKQGAVKINGSKVDADYQMSQSGAYVIQVGKRRWLKTFVG